jgi:hypothetical protein
MIANKARLVRPLTHATRVGFVGALVFLLAGCFPMMVSDFSPKSGMVCDEVRIDGTFYADTADWTHHVWFNGLEGQSYWRPPAPPGRQLFAVVPENAATGPIRVQVDPGWWIVLGVIGTDHTFPENFTVRGSPPAPQISFFSANPGLITEGQSTTLSWSVALPLTDLTLDGVSVLGLTSVVRAPTATHTYTLLAKNQCLERSRQTQVLVIPLPRLMSLDHPTYHPGQTLRAMGTGLSRTPPLPPAPSTLQFNQGANIFTVPDPTPSPTQLDATLPAGLVAGPVGVRAIVGGLASNMLTFAMDRRTDGAFIERTAQLGTSNAPCGTKQMQIDMNVAGWPKPILATFLEGGAVLTHHNFERGVIGGAAFSPGCSQAASVGFNVPGFTTPYAARVERFQPPYNRNFSVGITDNATGVLVVQRWHMLFSPDDTIVIVSSVPNVGPHQIVINIHDMKGERDITSPIFRDCPAGCASLQAEVIGGTSVRVTLDGTVLGTYPIFP